MFRSVFHHLELPCCEVLSFLRRYLVVSVSFVGGVGGGTILFSMASPQCSCQKISHMAIRVWVIYVWTLLCSADLFICSVPVLH